MDEECTPFLGISCWIGFQCCGIVAIGKPYDDLNLFGCRGSDSSAAIWFAVEHFEALVLKLFFFYTFYTTNLSRKPPEDVGHNLESLQLDPFCGGLCRFKKYVIPLFPFVYSLRKRNSLPPIKSTQFQP